LYRLALLMVDNRSLAERLAYLEELPVKDIRALGSVQESNYHGFKLSDYSVTCPECGGVFPVEIPFSITMFFPASNAVSDSVPDSV